MSSFVDNIQKDLINGIKIFIKYYRLKYTIPNKEINKQINHCCICWQLSIEIHFFHIYNLFAKTTMLFFFLVNNINPDSDGIIGLPLRIY